VNEETFHDSINTSTTTYETLASIKVLTRQNHYKSDLDTVPQLSVSGSPFLFAPVQSMLSVMSSLNLLSPSHC